MAATGGRLSWNEAKQLDAFERRAFVYAKELLQGAEVDWSNGRITRAAVL